MHPLHEMPVSGLEFNPFYAGYIAHLKETDPVPVLKLQPSSLAGLLSNVKDEQYAYAPGKWTIREVAGHLCDAERVFGYRLFCISRGERKGLPSFDENGYVARSGYSKIPLADHLHQFKLLREANVQVISQLEPVQFLKTGWASGKRISVRALVRILGGHVRHHETILIERYLS